MQTLKMKTMTAGLIAGLALATGAYAQMGQMKGMTHKGGMGMTGMSGMMGSMKMTGTMNGQPCKMQCGMMGMGGKGMMGKPMKMTRPMKMAGTITTMGHTYHCTMMMTPQGK